MAKCVAHSTQTGKPCQAWAIKGATVCRKHGGNVGRTRAAAARRLADAQAEADIDKALAAARELLDVPVDVDPTEELIEAVWRSAALVVYWSQAREQQMGDVPLMADKAGFLKPHALIAAYEAAVERLARIAKLAIDAGVAERQVRIVEEQARLMFRAWNKVLDDLDLTAEQRAAAPAAVRRRILEAAPEIENEAAL